MRRKVGFHPIAEADLVNLYNYIATQSGALRAEDYIGRIERLCASLTHFSERGAPRNDLASGVRSLSLDRRLRVVFRTTAQDVVILRIVYAGRDLQAVDLPEA